MEKLIVFKNLDTIVIGDHIKVITDDTEEIHVLDSEGGCSTCSCEELCSLLSCKDGGFQLVSSKKIKDEKDSIKTEEPSSKTGSKFY